MRHDEVGTHESHKVLHVPARSSNKQDRSPSLFSIYIVEATDGTSSGSRSAQKESEQVQSQLRHRGSKVPRPLRNQLGQGKNLEQSVPYGQVPYQRERIVNTCTRTGYKM